LILSVSRRTDIPAFYLDWFLKRLKEGFLLVRNPMSYHQVSEVTLSPKVIDCIVFWTKDPTKIITKLDSLRDYKYYFQITVNPYDRLIERNVPDKKRIIESFKTLSSIIGKDKVIWRYDPIILNRDLGIEYHTQHFNSLASELSNYTERCTISFLDLYKKTERNMKCIASNIDDELMMIVGKEIASIAKKYDLRIETCCEAIDLSSVGIQHAKCIDDTLISNVIGQKLEISKDKNQRDICGCVTSVDIGAYNTCKHMCLYCYANFSDNAMTNNIKKHNKNSPMLIGDLEPDDKITKRKMELYRQQIEQNELF
jgi:DNA repair photolyase